MKNLLIAAFIAGVLAGSGCKGYEDGPGFSLTKPKRRVMGEYIVTEFTVDGRDSVELFDSMYGPLGYPEIGILFQKHLGTDSDPNIRIGNNCECEGIWSLGESNETLTLVIYECFPGWNFPANGQWIIKRLTSKDMWLEAEMDNILYTLKFESND